MAAIAGIIAGFGDESPETICRRMLRALEPYASPDSAVVGVDSTSFGRNLDFLLPEDHADQQPVRAEPHCLFVADARLDNRDELISRLETRPAISDADMLFAAWQRWGIDLAAHVLGDYALASWDGARGELILLRSPFGYKPLFFARADAGTAFASEPCGIHASGLVPKAPDLQQAATIIESGWGGGSASIFKGIEQVPHGQAVFLRAGRTRAQRLWSPPQRDVARFHGVDEAGAALRAELDRAVRAQTRRASGHVGAQLSAGRDSSAVSTSAAIALRDEADPLLCFTGAPSPGFEALDSRFHRADESPLAAQTAERYPNIRHFIERPRPGDALAEMERLHALHHLPLLNPTNLPWWTAIERAAADRGVRVFLGGAGGNLTISLGGPEYLRDVVREESALASLKLALRVARDNPRHVVTLLNSIIGPALSAGQYRLIEHLAGRAPGTGGGTGLLRSAYRTTPPGDGGDPRPPRSLLDYRRSWMMVRDNPGKMNLARWGFEHRDPTMDLRLVEFCHSMPARYLFGAFHQRPAYDAAFAERLPSEVRQFARRGRQGADWPLHFPRDVVRSGLRKYAQSAAVRELIDMDAVDRLTAAWPNDDSPSVLAALSVASFLWVHFPG